MTSIFSDMFLVPSFILLTFLWIHQPKTVVQRHVQMEVVVTKNGTGISVAVICTKHVFKSQSSPSSPPLLFSHSPHRKLTAEPFPDPTAERARVDEKENPHLGGAGSPRTKF